MTPQSHYTIRPLAPDDEPTLWDMLYHAIFVAEGATPAGRDVLDQPEIARYVRSWGRAGDSGFIALETKSGQPIGAAWLRLFADGDRGYGTIDETVPELSIAVTPEYRGRGIGTRLLTQLLRGAAKHFTAVSLSVAADNPALRLYRRLGFEIVGRSGTALTMRKELRTE